MIITQEHIKLFNNVGKNRDKTSPLVTRVLLLKAEGMTHEQISSALEISKSYVSYIISAVRKAANNAAK